MALFPHGKEGCKGIKEPPVGIDLLRLSDVSSGSTYGDDDLLTLRSFMQKMI